MLEIILIISLSKKIGTIAENKGHKKGGYIALFVILWILGEIIGAIAGVAITGDDGFGFYIFAIIGAAIGALIAFVVTNNLQDKSFLKQPDSYFSESKS
jgi:MFS family permease